MKKRRREDDDLLDESIHEKSGSQTGLIVAMAITGISLILLICTCGGGVALIVYLGSAKQPDGTQPDRFLGSWKGRFLLHGQQRDVIYSFDKSGEFRESQFTLQGRHVSDSGGRWAFQNGEITINYNMGSSESAKAIFIDGNTIDYEIVRHDDLSQIGLKTTFRRQ